ncbi:MAG: hypothetical protein FWD97_10695 [Defluviitaleaceae bacterium]|nr:hypothetical protein [Defluviitaleaceae bacterium]
MGDSSKTRICYYQGAYGFTLRIDVKAREWLEYLKESILSLAEGMTQEIRLDCLGNVEIDNFKTLTLVKAQRKKYSIFSVPNDCISMSNGCFTWLQDTEELVTLIGLIDGLLDGSGSGHQYLTNEGDGVLIVLAYNE